LADVLVPDFKSSHQIGRSVDRPVGTKEEFLDRLENARSWIIERQMVTNTYLIHENMLQDMSKRGIIFEGAQAQGLHPWLGTLPDVTASDPSVAGIISGTAIWRPQDIKERIGVLKLPHTSSVGVREMPTHIELPKNPEDLPDNATPDQEWAARVREEANEYGTTTGRPRDINFLDLALLRYNARMSGIEVLAATHLDIARKTDNIKVCTHYTDKAGNTLPYKPDILYLANVKPSYKELPGWDGEACRRAESLEELPENALKFLAFIQARTGFPIVAVTTGPKRENLVAFPGYNP
jgi:adenylosuccinate synthase